MVWLSLVSLVAGLVAPASAEPEPPEPLSEVATPLASPSPSHPATPARRLPSRGVEPLEPESQPHLGAQAVPLPTDGTTPLEGPLPAHPHAPAAPLPPDGLEPLDDVAPVSDVPASFERPLGMGPPPAPHVPLDPSRVRLVRVDLLVGPVWRIRALDTMVSTSVEFGRMHGLSASFHTELLVVTQRSIVRALDVPIGVGLVARGRLRNKPLYGSVGLTAGILVHRAAVEDQVVHRVDPDLRLPIRLAWTMADFGASVAVVTGYSVRERSYERRGAEVLNRHSVRIGLLLGLHWDITAGRAKARLFARRQDGR